MKNFTPSKALAAATFLLPFLSRPVSSHYIFSKLIVGSTVTSDYAYVRQNTNSNSPLLDVTSTDIRCNTGSMGNAGRTGTYTVAAGSQVGMALNGNASIIHPGPLTVYLSRAPDGTPVSSYDGSGDWFKIYELGSSCSDSQNMYWYATDATSFNWTIPADTPPGEYLMRTEHIGLHMASQKDQAQFYVECAQLKITGGNAAAKPGPLVKIPGVYTDTDPNILINIYYPVPQNYTIPGPAVWPRPLMLPPAPPQCSGSGSTVTPSPTKATVISSSTSSSSSGATATLYGQCGGQGWNGPTTCPAGTACQAQNQYYSQCLPGSSSTSPVATSTGTSTGPSSSSPATCQQALYDQCGGSNWTGCKNCPAGSTCQVQNQYYSQCLPPSGDTKRRAIKGRVRRVGKAREEY